MLIFLEQTFRDNNLFNEFLRLRMLHKNSKDQQRQTNLLKKRIKIGALCSLFKRNGEIRLVYNTKP